MTAHFRCVQVSPLYLSDLSLDRDTFRNVLILGMPQIHISMVRDGKNNGETYTSDQHGAMFRELLNLYTSTQTGKLVCEVTANSFKSPTMWAFAFDWGVPMDLMWCFPNKDETIVSSYFAKWAAKNCRKLYWFYQTATGSCLLHFLVDAESNIESLIGLTLESDEVKRFSTILQQSLKVKELKVYLDAPVPSQVVGLVQTICRCSCLEKVTLDNRILVMPFKDWMNVVISLIQCGHLKEVSCRIQIDYTGYGRIDDAELSATTRRYMGYSRDLRTEMIIDIINKNPNLMKLDIGRFDHTDLVNVNDIDRTMAERRERSNYQL